MPSRPAAAALTSGDIFMITYSGHSGQAPDESGDEQDLTDETWCLYDGQLIDDELFIAWSAFRPRIRVVVLADSCHSGSVTRAALAMVSLPGNYYGYGAPVHSTRTAPSSTRRFCSACQPRRVRIISLSGHPIRRLMNSRRLASEFLAV